MSRMNGHQLDELPRLIRFVDHGTLPGEDVLSIYDPKQNLLIIDRMHFEKLHPRDKELVYRTNETALVMVNGVPMPARTDH